MDYLFMDVPVSLYGPVAGPVTFVFATKIIGVPGSFKPVQLNVANCVVKLS
jgi:hypothetical protein